MFTILTSNYAHQFLKLISSASASIDILCYVVNFNLYKRSDKVNLIFLALKEFVLSGGTVRFVLDFPKLHKPNYHCNKFSTRRFREAGFIVRYLHTGDTMHAKLFLFDQAHCVTGSHNLTSRSVASRFDVSLSFDNENLIVFFSSYFARIWQISLEV